MRLRDDPVHNCRSPLSTRCAAMTEAPRPRPRNGPRDSAARAIPNRSARAWAIASSAGWATRAGSRGSASTWSRLARAANRRCATGTRRKTSSSTCWPARSSSSPTTASRSLRAGMCAGYPGGKKDAHHFVNRSAVPATYLEVGNRTEGDNAFYPDDDLMWGEDENGVVRRAQGRPAVLSGALRPRRAPGTAFRRAQVEIRRDRSSCDAALAAWRQPRSEVTPWPNSPPPTPGTACRNRPVSAALLAYALFGAAAVVALVSSGFHFVAPLMGLVGIAGLDRRLREARRGAGHVGRVAPALAHPDVLVLAPLGRGRPASCCSSSASSSSASRSRS